MSKSTFRILFYLRKNYLNKSGKAGIMIRLTVNGDMVQFSSKLDIEPSLWDTKAGKAAGNSVKARQMNSMLEDIRTALSNHYRYVESRDSFVTAEKVRNAFLGYEVRQQTISTTSWTNVWQFLPRITPSNKKYPYINKVSLPVDAGIPPQSGTGIVIPTQCLYQSGILLGILRLQSAGKVQTANHCLSIYAPVFTVIKAYGE